MKDVSIIIPIYHTRFRPFEQASLHNTIEKLGHRDIVILKPEGLDTHELEEQYPMVRTVSVSNQWLGTQNGIAGYNEMMLSKQFYQLFADSRYILICHLDAWIFRDELDHWTSQGYDIVAAPWLAPRLRMPFAHTPPKNRVGNGGLCLRRVEACISACDAYADTIARYRSLSDHLHNEDVFWAVEPKEFRYPDVKTAVAFAIDVQPRRCYKLNDCRLPMGCHDFDKKSRRRFWQQFFPIPD
ncbi:MAG: hypothetical protein IJM81_10235 [Prevotella sp.]|nr:hypothetical protein [Prevotella sp.]